MGAAAAGSLKSRAWPIALALALVSAGGLLTDTVASSQMLSVAGPQSLSLVFILSGIAMGIAALAQFGAIDRRPRLRMLRMVGLTYAVAFAAALGLLMVFDTSALLTLIVWLLGDQIQLLVIVMLWSLAGDVFNTAESTRINGWILTWIYVGQLGGLLVASLSPLPLEAWGVPLVVVLVVNPIACLLAALWVPRRMRDQPTFRGNNAAPGVREALTSVREFLHGVPIWRDIVVLATLGATAGATALLGFSTSAEAVIGPDAARLQTYFGVAMFAVLIGSTVVELGVAPWLNRKVRVARQLLILPILGVVAGVVLAAGNVSASLVVLLIGMMLIGVPEYTVEDSARRAALAVVPDGLRARMNLVIDVARWAVAQVLAGALAWIGSATGALWLTGLLAAVVSAIAVVWGVRVARGWDASLLNWRLRRRKHRGLPDSGAWANPESAD